MQVTHVFWSQSVPYAVPISYAVSATCVVAAFSPDFLFRLSPGKVSATLDDRAKGQMMELVVYSEAGVPLREA